VPYIRVVPGIPDRFATASTELAGEREADAHRPEEG
jgi:hypothetical protein